MSTPSAATDSPLAWNCTGWANPNPRHATLYVDENGNHDRNGSRYLALVGSAIRSCNYYGHFVPAFWRIKSEHLGETCDTPISLHERDIKEAIRGFERFSDPSKRLAFNRDRISLMRGTKFLCIGVVLDKNEHFEKWGGAAWHPYHYCAKAIFERFVLALRRWNCIGDIVAESRNPADDALLQGEFEQFCEGSSDVSPAVVAKHITSRTISFRRKHDNVPGLQLSDMIAMPVRLDVLKEYGRLSAISDPWASRVCEVIGPKYDCSPEGRRIGWGMKLLN